ncbi:hypothetical protein C8R45DRAFT_948063 [Mycena sanguinolenta]|nr:hypothetical protein C8R45DRAFT_948063 [Mycena sanguinolenta]
MRRRCQIPNVTVTQASKRWRRDGRGGQDGRDRKDGRAEKEGRAEEASGWGGRVEDGRWMMEETGRKEEDKGRRIRRYCCSSTSYPSTVPSRPPSAGICVHRREDVPPAMPRVRLCSRWKNAAGSPPTLPSRSYAARPPTLARGAEVKSTPVCVHAAGNNLTICAGIITTSSFSVILKAPTFLFSFTMGRKKKKENEKNV